MTKKPINVVVKGAKEAVKRLNEQVEEGCCDFSHIGVNPETVTTVSRSSDGNTTKTTETVYRLVGLADAVDGEELEEFNAWKAKHDPLKKKRTDLNYTLALLNGKPMNKLSIFMFIVSVVFLAFGLLTLFKVLPLPESQIGIAIGLVIAGALLDAGAILVIVLRAKKIKKLNERRDEIEKEDASLKAEEDALKSEEPSWYGRALFTYKGTLVSNSQVQWDLKTKK